ncbi:hypothetical protein CEXT_401 [Caerostris extrusa]|uniref:Uncharacterized protein n=1 Tax=Caerostris extrusa TaxID=172846 RepID=A0AAV4SYV8_CAEEX|nr:hypothetical protein CEXT_401 [Caerostris extrusa]
MRYDVTGQSTPDTCLPGRDPQYTGKKEEKKDDESELLGLIHNKQNVGFARKWIKIRFIHVEEFASKGIKLHFIQVEGYSSKESIVENLDCQSAQSLPGQGKDLIPWNGFQNFRTSTFSISFLHNHVDFSNLAFAGDRVCCD